MTPTENKIVSVLRDGPLSYYDLASKIEVKGYTLNRAILALIDRVILTEVRLGEVIGLRLVKASDVS